MRAHSVEARQGLMQQRQSLSENAGPKSLQRPHILTVFTAQNVTFTVGEQDPKVRSTRGIPAVFDFCDVDETVTELELHRALVALITGVAFHADNLGCQ